VLGTHEDQAQVRLEDLVARAKPLGIPVLVDAASEHIERPSPYLKRGADMVIYSGGKFLRGPQTSGLLLGRKDLIEAAWRNASPHQAFARGMKVSKEDIIGVLAALEVWFEHRDPAEELRRWNSDLAKITAGLTLSGVSTEVIAPKGVVKVPRLRITWDAAKFGVDGEGLRLRVLEGEPRVMLDDMAVKANSIEIDPFGLQPGEAEQVARAISAALAMPAAAKVTAPAPKLDVSGAWDVRVNFLFGERTHRLSLKQDGGAITGDQTSQMFDSPVTGSLDADGVHLMFRTRYEGATIFNRLDGTVAGNKIEGNVVLGSGSDHHQGPINQAQFGSGQFQAVRAGGM
jgi:L-seryl-tRNA(Ser) seleniumtransferase